MNSEALDTAIARLAEVVAELEQNEEPSVEELAEWAQKLPDITYALAYGTRALRDRVLALGDRFVLEDGRGRPPEECLIETADALRALNTMMERADPAAREYLDKIQYLGVVRALEPGEPPSLEVRTATAADMARRIEPTTHVDREPASLMNDTVLGQRRRP